MPEKIIKQTLSEQIYNILKEDILSGRILMGDKLTNRELQERFQVSSTPVRDAINRLSKDGLTQEVSKSGAQLITFDYSYANELNDFITFLACRAVMLSSTEPDTEKLVEKLQMYEEEMAGAKTSMEYFEADFRYHKVFFDHCGNRFMKETYKQYNFIRTFLYVMPSGPKMNGIWGSDSTGGSLRLFRKRIMRRQESLWKNIICPVCS